MYAGCRTSDNPNALLFDLLLHSVTTSKIDDPIHSKCTVLGKERHDMSDLEILGTFKTFVRVARDCEASANVEPGKLVMYSRKSTAAQQRNVCVSFGSTRFIVPVPTDLGCSMKTVFGDNQDQREAILEECFLRARLATLSEASFDDLQLEARCGSFVQHRERMAGDGSLTLATALKAGFGVRYEVLLEAIEADIRSDRGRRSKAPIPAQDIRTAGVAAKALTLFPAT